jgi:hypothetical protein
MTRPCRPLINEGITLPPATFIGGKDRLFVRHDNDPKLQRTFGVVIMAPAGLNLLNSSMRNVDKTVLIALISKLQWFDIDYEATRSGDRWKLKFDRDGESIRAKIKESGIATTGLTHENIVDLIHGNSDPLLEILTEAYAAINGNPIDRDRAVRILNASTKSTYSVKQIKRSISRLKAIGVIIGSDRAGPDRLYYILNPFLYCNGPVYMRRALIRLLANPDTNSIRNFSEDLSNVGPPRRRKTNADLLRELDRKDSFIEDLLKVGELPEEMRQRGIGLLGDDHSHEDGEHPAPALRGIGGRENND